MKNLIESRLKELQTEYQKGQEQLVTLEQETATLKSSMLRINGAIQVLEELLQQKEPDIEQDSTKSNNVELIKDSQ